MAYQNLRGQDLQFIRDERPTIVEEAAIGLRPVSLVQAALRAIGMREVPVDRLYGEIVLQGLKQGQREFTRLIPMPTLRQAMDVNVILMRLKRLQ
ncbi:MAG TPA: hypothetical protein VI159_08865 [Gemmatimonadales bacterium]